MADRDQIITTIRDEAVRQGVDPALALAVAESESSFNPDAVGDSGRSVGLFQLQPGAAQAVGLSDRDRYDPDKNIAGGIRYLKQQLDLEKGDERRALTRYNTGTPTYQGIGTPGYAEHVLSRKSRYGGEGGVSPTSNPLVTAAKTAGSAVLRAVSPASAEAAGPASPQQQQPVQPLPAPGLNITVTARGPGVGGAPETTDTPPPATPRSPDAELMEAIGARDPRLPIIESGLKIMGKTREDFGVRFEDPRFVQRFYESTLGYAEHIDPELNDSKSLTDYNNSLTKHFEDVNKQGPPAPPPEPPPPPPPPPPPEPGVFERMRGAVVATDLAVSGAVANGIASAYNWLAVKPDDIIAQQEIVTGQRPAPQGTEGPPGLVSEGPLTRAHELAGRGALKTVLAAPDVITDIANLWQGGVESITGLPTTRFGTLGGPTGTVQQLVDEVVSKPAGIYESIVESAAQFLLPFSQLQKAGVFKEMSAVLGTSTRLRRWIGNAFSGAGSGFTVDALLTDPDDPFFMNLLERLYRGYGQGDWTEIKGLSERFFDGTVGEDELRRRFAARGLRAAEGLVAGPLFEPVISAFKMLRLGKALKYLSGYEPGQRVDPGAPLPDPITTQQRIRDDTSLQDFADLTAFEREAANQRIDTTPAEQAVSLDDIGHAEGLRILDEVHTNPNAPSTLSDAQRWLRDNELSTLPHLTVIRGRLETYATVASQGSYVSPDLVVDAATDLATMARARMLRDVPTTAVDEPFQITEDIITIQEGIAVRADIVARYGPETTDSLFRALAPTPPLPRQAPAPETAPEIINPLTGEQLTPPTPPRYTTPMAERMAQPPDRGPELTIDQTERGQVLLEELRANPDSALGRKDAGDWIDETATSNTPLARGIRTEIENLTGYTTQPPGAREPEALLPRGPEVPGTAVPGERAAAAQAETSRVAQLAAETAERAQVAGAAPPQRAPALAPPATPLGAEQARRATAQAVRDRNETIVFLHNNQQALDNAIAADAALTKQVAADPRKPIMDVVDEYNQRLGADLPPGAQGASVPRLSAADADAQAQKLLSDVDKPPAASGMTTGVQRIVRAVTEKFEDPVIQRVVLSALLRGAIGGIAAFTLYDPGFAEADTPEARQEKQAASFLAIALTGLGFAVGTGAVLRYIRHSKGAIDATGRIAPDAVSDARAAARPSELPASRGPWATAGEIAEVIRTHPRVSPTEIRQAGTLPLTELTTRRSNAVNALDTATRAGRDDAALTPLKQRADLYTGMEQRAQAVAPTTPHPDSTAATTAVRRSPPVPGERARVRTADRPEIVHRLKTTRLMKGQRAVTFVKTAEEGIEAMRVNADFAHDPDDMRLALAAFENAVPKTLAGKEALIPTSTNDLVLVAETLGMSARKLDQLLKASNTPHELSARVPGVVMATQQSLNTFYGLMDRIKAEGGVHKIGDDLKTEFTEQLNRTGQWIRGLEMTISDMGRGLHAVRQLRNGNLGRIITEGKLAGREVVGDKNIDDIIQEMDTLRAQGEGASKYIRKITTPTAGAAFTGEWLEVLLGSFGTPIKAGLSTLEAFIYRPFVSLAGALASHVPGNRQNLLVNVVQRGSPPVAVGDVSPLAYESMIMWGSLITNAVEASKVFGKSMWTGKTPHMATGTKFTRREGPAITAEAMQNTWHLGPLIKNSPYAAAVVDAYGVLNNLYGVRFLNSVSETSQFMAGRQELKSQAYRAAMIEATRGTFEKGSFLRNSEEFTQFMRDYMDDPPADAVAVMGRTQQQVDFMQSLFAPDENFLRLRQALGHMQQGMDKLPALRVSEPFIRSTVNILTGIAENTPVAVLSQSFRHHFTGPDPVLRAAAQGRLIASTSLAMFGAYLGYTNIGRGPITYDPDLREQYTRAGYIPNSITIPDTNVTIKLNPAGIVGFVLTASMAIGQYARTFHAETGSSQIESHAATAVALAFYELGRNALFNRAFGEIWSKTPAQWEAELEGQGKTGKTFGETVIEDLDNLLFGHLPSRYVREMVQIIDPHKRVFDTLWEEWQTRIPGFLRDSALVTETNVFREKRLIGEGLTDSTVNNAARVIAGMGFRDEPPDPMHRALAEKGVEINDPKPVFSIPGSSIRVPLKPAEHQRLRWLIGHPEAAPRSFKAAVEAVIAQPDWQNLSPGPEGQAALKIKALYRLYTDAARAELWNENTEWSHTIRERLLQQAIKTQRMNEAQLATFQATQQQRLQLRTR